MGHKQSRTTECVSTEQQQQQFKLFEYACPKCKSKRPIQYFHKDDKFLPQAPRVVCGECNTSVTVEPFKTVEYGCPSCKKWQKARIPAKPMPLNMYNVSVVSCNCGFKGQVAVGRLMDVTCSQCWQKRRELCDVWSEDNEEHRTYCSTCQDYKRSFVHVPKKKGEAVRADMEYMCENCFRVRPIHAEELLRSDGLACCSLCQWVGYPEVHAQGHCERQKRRKEEARRHAVEASRQSRPSRDSGASSSRMKRPGKVRPEPEPMRVVPGG